MNFLITIQATQSPDIATALFDDLTALALPVSSPKKVSLPNQPSKGDPITLLSVFAIAVGAGGALTAALSKNGFFTQLARVLEKYIDRQIQLEIEQKSGRKLSISGSAAEIRQLMKSLLETPPED